MPQRVDDESGEWRLGAEAESQAALKPAKPEPARDLSAQRLDRPLYVLTAEHLGWFLVLLWTFASRLLDLGGRPMAQSEADRALAALQALGAHPSIAPGWFTLTQSLLFSGVGAGEAAARMPAALLGVLLVGSALMLRRELGRAGALALGAILALSPTVTYYSRSDSTVVPALALTMLAVAFLCAVARRPARTTALGLAVAVALAISAASVALVTAAILAVILVFLGIWQALTVKDAGVRLRVWWERRHGLAIAGIIVAVAALYALETGFFERPFLGSLVAEASHNWIAGASPDFRDGISFYLPELVFYEFLVAALAAIGTLAMLAFRLRSKLSVAAFLWMAASAAFFLWTPVRRPALIVATLVPAAILAASAIDWLHHTAPWRFVRYPILALALLTLYAQVLNNFVWTAPDPTEAPWARHALLYWTEPATTLTTPEESEHALKAVGPHASVFFELKPPVLKWYLRALDTASDAQSASVTVSATTAPRPPEAGESSAFTFQERWNPRMSGLDAVNAIRYFLTARTWAPLQGNDVRLSLRKPVAPSTPTEIFAPRAQASPAATPSAPLQSPTPPAESTPAAGPLASPAASPSPMPTSAAISSPTTTAAPSSAATPEPTASPKPEPAARKQHSPTPAPGSPAPSSTPEPTDSPTPENGL